MFRWTLLTVASLAAATLAGCSAVDGSDASAEAPEWAPGHEWSYSWERESKMESDLERRDDWRASDEDTTFRVVANATPFQAEDPGWLVHRDGDQVSSFFFPWSPLVFMREGDLRPAPGDDFLDSSCPVGGSCTAAYDEHATIGSTDRSGPFIDFPVRTGKTWKHEIYGDVFEARVMGQGLVTVDAGRFQTVHIQYVMADADDPVEGLEEQGATVHKYDVDTEVVFDVHYVPDVEWVVLYEVDARTAFDIDITWPGEDRYTDAGTATLHESIGLTRYDLREEEPLDADALAEALGIEASTPGPYGVPEVVESNVTVEIDVSADQINLADDDTVVLSASAEGDAPSYNHTWVVKQETNYYYPSYFDPAADGIDGAKIVYFADDVARYKVQAFTFDDGGRLVDLQEVGFEAVYAVSGSADCDTNVMDATSAYCGSMDFPVAGNDLHLTVTATYEGDRLLDNPSLVVLDATGREQARKEMPGDEVTIDTSLWSLEGTWSTHVEPPTGTGGSVTYDIRVQPAGVSLH